MRWPWLVTLVACKGSSPAPGPAPAQGSGSAVVNAPGDSGWPLIDLLHSAPSTITLSSRVANPAIKPEHLADHDFDTAWNSKTGELVGAWIDIAVPEHASIVELRMTAGHTGKGPKGEDYFTMNPRIRAIKVLHGDYLLGELK